MNRGVIIIAASLAIATPGVAQEVSVVPAIGSSAAEGRALLEPLCESFVLTEEKYLTCTWDSTGAGLTGSYTNKGRLYYVQWIPAPSDMPKSSIVENTVAAFGFSGLSKPCDFLGDKVPCWEDTSGTYLRHDTFSDGRIGFYLWNGKIEAEDGSD